MPDKGIVAGGGRPRSRGSRGAGASEAEIGPQAVVVLGGEATEETSTSPMYRLSRRCDDGDESSAAVPPGGIQKEGERPHSVCAYRMVGCRCLFILSDSGEPQSGTRQSLARSDELPVQPSSLSLS